MAAWSVNRPRRGPIKKDPIMLPSSTLIVLDLARQQQNELARETRQGYVRYAGPGRRRRRRRQR
jgi:hypothetical protein